MQDIRECFGDTCVYEFIAATAKGLIMALTFKEPHVIRATYRIVTPMFIGDADRNPADGIRPPSIKGALRFWWRALNWGRFWREKAGNEPAALKALHEEEARLFGSSMDEKRAQEHKHSGQGCFAVIVNQQPSNKNERVYDWPPNTANHGASYLAFGLLETQDESHRSAIPEGGDFTIQVLFKPNAEEAYVRQIIETLRVWSLFGGLGSRARRSFGSVALLTLSDQNEAFTTKNDYQTTRATLLAQFDDIPPAPFTAFSRNSIQVLWDSGKDVREVVKTTGQRYKDYRSTLKGKTNERISFGLPLQNIDLENRRSSPLLFHVHELANKGFISSGLYLPSRIFHCAESYQELSTHAVKAFISGDKL
jgi:CRISPR-associated protein Cmr1